MMLKLGILIIVAAGLYDVLASPMQAVLQAPAKEPRRLHGRFLHITDIHPDPHYLAHTSEKTACHREKGKKSKNRAGYYGTPFSECDSPLALTNHTLDYLDKTWASEIDFVVWTGDNARHDNDPKIPRTPDEIFSLNRVMAAKMREIFTSKGIPVVPSLGTRPPSYLIQLMDMSLQETMTSGVPTKTRMFLGMANIDNIAVDGCNFHDQDDPGNLQIDWLEVQLKMYRERDMQVWITGHVPPSPGNYFPDCYVRYVELSLRFQDTVLGHLFGHMNFSFLESVDLDFYKKQDRQLRQQTKSSLYDTLMQDFAALFKSGNVDYSNYAVVNTASSVVPNPFLPSFRIFAYNITGEESRYKASKRRSHGHEHGDRADKTAQCRLRKNQDTWKCFLNETWHSDPESPSRSNKQWTPLGYAQYYLPDLGEADETREPTYELEYLTFCPRQLHPAGTDGRSTVGYPIPLKRLPKSLRNPNVTESKYAPYSMRDLTIPSWVELAQRLGDEAEEELRGRFRRNMYMGAEDE
ncbi:hypothetical protein C0992_001450 [Termitomyces sp. T32_za158]|nr:hypothetical protein C0992_001450 [Termitomyces sp. T32_za158]